MCNQIEKNFRFHKRLREIKDFKQKDIYDYEGCGKFLNHTLHFTATRLFILEGKINQIILSIYSILQYP